MQKLLTCLPSSFNCLYRKVWIKFTDQENMKREDKEEEDKSSIFALFNRCWNYENSELNIGFRPLKSLEAGLCFDGF